MYAGLIVLLCESEGQGLLVWWFVGMADDDDDDVHRRRIDDCVCHVMMLFITASPRKLARIVLYPCSRGKARERWLQALVLGN